MSKILVLAEKPSVGKEIARVLKCNRSGNGFIEGENYIVTWALGHLVTLADPDTYDAKYATWKLDDLPMLPAKFKLTVIKQTSKQFNVVKGLMLRAEVKEIIIATDAGREGELVARWIIEKIGIKKIIKRLWISSVTDKAIKEGFANLKDGKQFEKLFASAVARAEIDWIVGINATRALTCKYNAQLSCGRVQTPTLAMIAKREEEIQNFVSKEFYGIIADVNNFKLTWQDNKTKDVKSFDKEHLTKIMNSIQKGNAEIIDINKTDKKIFAPKLYDLTELQRDANKIFGFSAKETLSVMQKLYETHKILTYPRTDSRYLTEDIVDTIEERLKACGIGSYSTIANSLLKKPIKAHNSFVNNSKVSDHHAIIPTEQTVLINKLTTQERKIYDLVVKRFFAVLSTPFEYEQTAITAKIGEHFFIAKGKIVKNLGWKKIYENNIDEEENIDGITEQKIPLLNKGDKLNVSSLILTSGKTKPPQLFNEATLLSAMENPVKYMNNENKDLIRIIKETGGIGTVATRADIIEKLNNTFLIEKRGKEVLITSRGKQLLSLVPDELRSPALTAEWEKRLENISKGIETNETFINEMRIYTRRIVKEIKNSEAIFRHDNITTKKCPECGKNLLEVNGKKGKMLICQDRECGYRKGLSIITNARCPNCHKKLELRGEGEGQAFVCRCGHKEKLSSFNERKKKEKGRASKGDVNNYLKQQNKEPVEPFNSALADLLKDLKLK